MIFWIVIPAAVVFLVRGVIDLIRKHEQRDRERREHRRWGGTVPKE
ncbi:MAG TPA: hypothetical protein VG347_00785 [Verrucomicrobiae bacterium]|nr:hypothetical protein [Verrucomicrobiae bacterium]